MPRGVNQNYDQLGGRGQAQFVLGNQPPPLEAAMVRYIQLEEVNQESALVPMEHYGGEVNETFMGNTPSYETLLEPSIILEGKYQMDHNTLWFIANGMIG